MEVGICGLGLIGGSLAKDFRAAGAKVWGWDENPAALAYGCDQGLADGILDAATLGRCQLLLLAVYPAAVASYLASVAPLLRRDCLVVDLCGIKSDICAECFPLAAAYGFTFVGGHPLAGTEFSGGAHAQAGLFRGAPLVLVLPRSEAALAERVRQALAPAGFGSFPLATAEEHDKLIAYTSQLPHILASAYIQGAPVPLRPGFSAGSFRDLTRVARLNEILWSQLLLANSGPLLTQLDSLLARLSAYRQALAAGDEAGLSALLRRGREAKEAADSRNPANETESTEGRTSP